MPYVRAADAIAALERVADKALQVGEAALANYRCNRSSQTENAAILHRAVRSLQATWSARGCMPELHMSQPREARQTLYMPSMHLIVLRQDA